MNAPKKEKPLLNEIESLRAKLAELSVSSEKSAAERKLVEERITQMTRYDSLTGLANRASFVAALEEQIAAKIDEDKIALVQPGMSATIRLEAFADVELAGRVMKINEFPEPEEWLGSAVKQYKTIVRIDQPPPGTRPGMTAAECTS